MNCVLAIVCFLACLSLLEAQSTGGSSGEMSSVGNMGGLGGGGNMNDNDYDTNEIETNELDNEMESNYNAGMPNLFGNGASNLADSGTTGGQKAGIVIGTILLVALIAGGAFYFIKRR
ncbi:uncharacterized protein LOC121415048 [Lytechinus variegatus]|uniref:uncharacterized protein LOC121415048 n=1 Tax=Lytechinus variegatus TaxID=7654 RepID=UPI001BB16555|nr:uncharacterized protein LOC121415048 [Lytechinus variegatus]